MPIKDLRATVGWELIGGAVGSVALTTYAGMRVGAPLILKILFGGWVLMPFAALAIGMTWRATRAPLTRRALEVITPVVAIVSLAVYAAVALGASRPKTAVFVLVAPASLVVIVAALITTMLLSRDSTLRRRP